MAKKNPFSMTFGKEPGEMIARISQTNEIREAFMEKNPPFQAYIVTGVRGAGKTVMLTSLSKQMQREKGWIVVDVSPERDILQALAAQLYAVPEIYSLVQKAKLNLSVFGLGVSIEKVPPVTDIQAAIDALLEQAAKKKKRVLITLDEVAGNRYVREFVSAFQIFVRHDHPIFLLMTGLYDNLYDLQNEKTLTFLYRAPNVVLGPLNHSAIVQRYMSALGIDQERAIEMARLTKGYPFAFQTLGYLAWNAKGKCSIEELLPDFDQYLSEFVYQKIWSELSELDRKILKEIAKGEPAKVRDIRNALDMSSGLMSVYRDRLKKKGLVETGTYGRLSFALPRFAAFVQLY